MLKNPKPGFEEVIKLHFKHRKVPLLKSLHGWIDEVRQTDRQQPCCASSALRPTRVLPARINKSISASASAIV
jgi:hypothetical protein